MGVGIFLDIILIVILVLNIIIGYKQGLIKVVFNVFAFLIAIIATLILYKPIANLIIENTQFDENIQEIVLQNNIENKNLEETKVENVNTEKNETLIQKYITDAVKSSTEEVKEQAMELIAKNVSIKIINILTALALFIIIRIALILLKFISETLASLPIIKQFNETGGLIYGAVRGLIINLILLSILFMVVSVNGNGNISKSINESYITKYLYVNYSNYLLPFK